MQNNGKDEIFMVPSKRMKYPIYIISKGRWESHLTSKTLEEMNIPYRIVIEPQELDNYSAIIDPKKILILPFSNLGQGSIPARNWVWEHSILEGYQRHWILDDNIDGFFYFNRNKKQRVDNGWVFQKMEEFTDRYKKIALSGPDYTMFICHNYGKKGRKESKPFQINTRIYSCILINNNIPFRWRGRYNEDTDLSIRCLKAGWYTILFHAFLQGKKTTMTMKGGNTDELYKDDGRLKMAQSLLLQHPDIVKIAWKWGRWQHQVDYRKFKKNKLILNDNVKIQN